MQLTPQEEQIYAVLSRILVEDFEVPAEKIPSTDGSLKTTTSTRSTRST